MNTSETHHLLEKATKYSYADYRKLLTDLMAENKTTGPNQSPDILEYSKLNLQRMNRLDKTLTLQPELAEALQNLNRNLYWVVITEGWCGDAAQNVPVFDVVAKASGGKIKLDLVLRDENLELMDRYLTNGGRSIPKMICFDAETGEELGTWGPRPAEAQRLFLELKQKPDLTMQEFTHALHTWYSQDKTRQMQHELTELLKTWQKS